MNSSDDIYATRDLHLAAFLKLNNMNLLRLEKQSNHHDKNLVYFIFENRQRCEELDSVFWSGVGQDVSVNIKLYCDAIRDLRGQIFASNSANLTNQ